MDLRKQNEELYFEDLDLNLEISERSILYPLEPIGIGTPFVESLTSYINRLAFHHKISVRNLFKVIFKHIERTYPCNSVFFRECCNLNGICKNSSEYAKALNYLTGRNDLELLTFIPWKSLITNPNLVKKNKAYCPYCYQEQKDKENTVYDQLLWSCSYVSVCSVHNIALVDYCPHKSCSKPLMYNDEFSFPGYCSKCNNWLGIDLDNNQNIITEKMLWDIGQISQITVELSMKKNDLSVNNMCSVIKQVRNISSSNLRSICKHLNISYESFCSWNNNTIRPSLGSLLTTSASLNAPLLNVLKNEVDVSSIDIKPTQDQKADKGQNMKTKRADENEILNTLNGVINSKEIPPPYLEEIARRLNTSSNYLTRNYTDLAKAIVSNRLGYEKRKKEVRLNALYNEIKATILQIYNEGEYPGQKNVSERMKRPKMFIRPEVTQVWRETLKELGVTER